MFELGRSKGMFENSWEDNGGLIINEVAESAIMLISNHLFLVNELQT